MDGAQGNEIITTALTGLWAFLGSIMRSGMDWKDPKTGKFSYSRFGSSVATALVLGQVVAALGEHYQVETKIIVAGASLAGYLGPAATLALIQQRFGAKPSDPPKP